MLVLESTILVEIIFKNMFQCFKLNLCSKSKHLDKIMFKNMKKEYSTILIFFAQISYLYFRNIIKQLIKIICQNINLLKHF